MFDSRIGKRMDVTKDEGFPSHTKILEFQEQYIDVWKSAYAGALASGRPSPDQQAKTSCVNFFEFFGRPNKLYFSRYEYDTIMKDIDKSDY